MSKDLQALTFSQFMASEGVKNKINSVIGGKNAQGFTTALVSAVSANPQLAMCDKFSILSSAMIGEGLKLAPSPQLGYYYLVPFKGKNRAQKVCQFQIGYKGLIQLALRSGQYADLDVMEILEGEYLGRDSSTGKFRFQFISDEEERQNKPVIGYMAYFELLNGFRKTVYWSKEKMQNHAKEYSQGYMSDLTNKTSHTFWSKDFDGMAFKTMLKQLLSKWAPLSVELQTAIVSDQAVTNTKGVLEYPDNDNNYNNSEIIDYTPEPLDNQDTILEEEPKTQNTDENSQLL